MGEDVDHLLRGRGAARLVGQLHLFGRQVWSEVEKPVRKNHQRVARLQTCLAGQKLAVRKDADRSTALGQQLLARGSPQQSGMPVARIHVIHISRVRIERAVEDGDVGVIDLERR